MTTQPLRILIAEDSAADAELMLRELRRAGFKPEWTRVQSEEEYVEMLHPELDIILSDYAMPQFGGPRALELLKERNLDIPFIILSGTIGEDVAVTVMKQGAADYLLKDRLGRLGTAVAHALQECRLRRERKQADEELRLFRTLIDQSTDTFEVIDPETGRFLDVNEKSCIELGYSRAEYLALSVFDIDPTLTKETWPERVAKIRSAGSWRGEAFRKRKDGTRLPTEFNAKWVVLDRSYIVTVIRDVTERKRTEERLRRLVDSNAQGVMFWKLDGSITGANAAFLDLVGYSREDLDAGRMNWLTMTPPEYAAGDRQALLEIVTKSACAPFEKQYIRKDGSRVNVLIGAASFEDNPDEGVGFAVDLTERIRLEQQYLRAQRMESIGTLAGGIAHDLNNILAPIMMSATVLRGNLTAEVRESIISTIEVSAERGAQIIKQVLTFGRGMKGEKRPLQFGRLIEEPMKIMASTFPKDISVTNCVSPDLWPVLGDATQLHQVLLNLCVNARDAMPHGGTLSIHASNIELDASSTRATQV